MPPVADWQSAFSVMKANFSLTDDATGIFAINLRFNLDDIQTIATEAITGGGDDKKCDVLYVDKERQLAVIAQCYISSSPRQAAPASKASDLNTAITWLLTSDLLRLPEALKGRTDELRAAIEAGEIKQLYIWYVHNLPCSKNVGDELRTVEQTAKVALAQYSNGQDIVIFSEEIGEEQLTRLYTQAERTVIVTAEIETTVPDAIEVREVDWTSVITTVRGSWLYELYHTYGTDLFSANLRAYLGSRESESNINNGIKTTASEQPSNFYVYNNGITALVLDYHLGKRSRSGRRFKIVGISIVNGAQTTGSIANLTEKPSVDLLVAIRFVRPIKTRSSPTLSALTTPRIDSRPRIFEARIRSRNDSAESSRKYRTLSMRADAEEALATRSREVNSHFLPIPLGSRLQPFTAIPSWPTTKNLNSGRTRSPTGKFLQTAQQPVTSFSATPSCAR
jgi:AIPR protein